MYSGLSKGVNLYTLAMKRERLAPAYKCRSNLPKGTLKKPNSKEEKGNVYTYRKCANLIRTSVDEIEMYNYS